MFRTVEQHRITPHFFFKMRPFFGLSCIEKWLNSTGGNDCPTCNEKATKKDIRHHYVAKLKAIDTGDRDRAIEQVDSLKKELRKIELESAQMKVIILKLDFIEISLFFRDKNWQFINEYINRIIFSFEAALGTWPKKFKYFHN